MLLAQIIEIYSFIVLGSILISWINLPHHHPVARFLETMTEPVLKPIRQILPPMGGLDFSPMILLVGLNFLARATL
ncbi:MAG: YggT family protein [Myxococcota bacterium]|nr:YggT family protein [Myxococcota bacterium]